MFGSAGLLQLGIAGFRIPMFRPCDAFCYDSFGKCEENTRLCLEEFVEGVTFQQCVEDGHVVHDADVSEDCLLALDHTVEVAAVL